MLSRIFEGDDTTMGDGEQTVSPEQIKKQEQDTFKHLENSAKYAEFDCVTFGLETDDGSIVKVYVKTEDAEKFEEALSALLGKMDDIEEALNEIGQEFEIVDVEWPDEDSDDDAIDVDPALNAEVYDDKEKKEKVNKKIPDSDVTEGMRFADKILGESGASIRYILPHTKVAKEALFILSEFGIEISSEMFLAPIKKIHTHAIKNLSDDDKLAIIQFAHRIRLISSNKAVPVSDKGDSEKIPVEESYDFDAKFRSKIEHMIFNMVKFLIIGKDGDDISAYVKPQQYSAFVQAIKTSKFKQNAYRQSIKNFLFKTGLNEEVSSVDLEILEEKKKKADDKPTEKTTEKTTEKSPAKAPAKVEKPKAKPVKPEDKSMSSVEKSRKDEFEKNDTYKELASKDKNVKLAVDILKWLGFSEDVLENSTVKMELRHGVRSRVKRIMGTPEAKRVKMLWAYDLEKKLEESRWTDEDTLASEVEDLSASDLKPKEVTKKFELPDSVHYKPWTFTTDKDANETTFDNGKVTIVFSDESFEKIVKSINDEKKAFVVKDTSDTKWVFTQNEIGGLYVVQQGKTDKKFLTPLDIENMLK
jgi:hypothetical protein